MTSLSNIFRLRHRVTLLRHIFILMKKTAYEVNKLHKQQQEEFGDSLTYAMWKDGTHISQGIWYLIIW